MKKYLLYLFAVLILFSCMNENLSVMNSEKEAFYCCIESDASTKTAIGDYNGVVWSEDDQLVIFKNSSVPAKYQVSDNSVGKAAGSFYKIETDEFNAGFELGHNVAFYPYQENIEIIKYDSDEPTSSYKLKGYIIPSQQTYVENSFAAGSFPMAAVSDDNNLLFRNICGGIKLSLQGLQRVTSITIKGNNSEKISGKADVIVYPDGSIPEISMSSDALTSVTLDCGDGIQLDEENAADFILALPPVKFTKGFTVSVVCADGSIFTMDTDKSNRIRRSSLLVMPVRTLGESYVDEGSCDDLNAPTLPGHNPEPCFSETVELMGMLWRLAGSSEYCECQVYSVTSSADEYFATMKNHHAVQLAKEYRQQGVCYDAVTGFANQLIFNENGTLVFDPDYLEGSNQGFEPRWNEQQRNDMLIAVNDFYEESDFHTWFISTKAEQEQAIASFKSVCNLDYSWFDTFYGKNDKISSRIILSFIIGPNNNGISLKRKDGSMFLTPVLGCLSQYNGNVCFGGDMNLIVHEFSHPYCNPLIEANWSAMADSADEIYTMVSSAMQSQAYSNAKTMMCETLVRACSIRYMMSHNQSHLVPHQIEYEEYHGFLMIRSILKLLEKYEQNSYSYASLSDFMPEIINVVNDFINPKEPEPDTLPHDYVDLGLEMSDGRKLYFATRNIGETSSGGIGSTAYRWGAIHDGGLHWTPPVGPYKGWPAGHRLDVEHDIATIEWGGDWHVPSPEEWEALVEQCDYERKEGNESGYGVSGYFFYNKNDRNKFVFLPVSDWSNQPEYWTSEIDGSFDNTCNVCSARKFNSYDGELGCFGEATIENWCFAVRPVIAAEGNFDANGHDYVDLGIKMTDGKKLYFGTMNVGETSPAGFNTNTYRWGATEESGFPWAPDAYYDDKKLDAAHDVATLTWGEKWHVPSPEEWKLLVEKCDYERKEAHESGYGVAGYFFYNKSDHSKFIFLPVSNINNELKYWTSLMSGRYDAYIFVSKNGRVGCLEYLQLDQSYSAIRPVFVE